MLRHLPALLLILLAGPAFGDVGKLKPADVRLLEGAEAFVAAFLARPGLRYEPEPARLDRHGRHLAHVFSGPLWLQQELVARGLAVVAAGSKAAYPLTDRVRCGVCGGAMTIADKHRYRCVARRRDPESCANSRVMELERMRNEALAELERLPVPPPPAGFDVGAFVRARAVELRSAAAGSARTDRRERALFTVRDFVARIEGRPCKGPERVEVETAPDIPAILEAVARHAAAGAQEP